MERIIKWKNNLRNNNKARKYLINRGFDNIDVLINKYNIGCDDNYIIFPNIVNGKLVYISRRSYINSISKHKNTKRKVEYFYNHDLIRYDKILITESVIDCITVDMLGIIPTIGCYGTNGYPKDLSNTFSKNKKIFILFDRDKPGLDGSIKLGIEIYKQTGVKPKINKFNHYLFKDIEIKDFNDCLQKFNKKILEQSILCSLKTAKIQDYDELIKEQNKKYKKVKNDYKEFDLVDLAYRFIPTLDKVGNGIYQGVCPFHNDIGPSFTVYQSSNRYHCFGCNSSGNPIGFVLQLFPYLSPKEAIQYLKHLQ